MYFIAQIPFVDVSWCLFVGDVGAARSFSTRRPEKV
jgi:hypothetical protein